MNSWSKYKKTFLRTGFAILVLVLAMTWIAGSAFARPEIDYEGLMEIKAEAERTYEIQRGPQFWEFVKNNNLEIYVDNVHNGMELMGVTLEGEPIFYKIDNVNAAATSRADELYPGAGNGYSVTGAFTAHMAMWDAGVLLTTHQEFVNLGYPRAINRDATSVHYHSQHVGGTMIAGGVSASARGMSYEAYLDSYDWNQDTAEMASAAATGTRITNHSYGTPMGWEYEFGQAIPWVWYGLSTMTYDRNFGEYNSQTSRTWDNIAHDNPYLSICVSAGNDRSDSGPGPNGLHRLAFGGTSTMTREPDGGDFGYDIIGYRGVAKNLLTVGAVNDVLNYSGPGSVAISSFSSYGPTDDGRIKPDIVANGVNLRSTGETSNTDYAVMSGTSMSSPSAAGTLNLLFIHYENTFDEEPLSTTLRGLVIHTADECGSWDGPDYRYGWGLMNALAAADHITWASVNLPAIQERELTDGSTYVQDLARYQDEDIRVTLIWNEPMGPNHAIPGDQTPVLVNDLDIRLEDADNGTIYYPWVLGGIDNPNTPATSGDNIVDNVEQIWIEAPAGENYQLTVSHKGTLSETTSYTLLISGLIDASDPREPVTNLVGEANYGDQTIELDWDHPGGDTFQHHRVIRDGNEVGTTTETSYIDDVPGFGTFVYQVVPVYDEGEPLQNPTVDVLFADPIPASFFSYSVIDEPSMQIELMWEQTRAIEKIYDDGESELPGLSFVDTLPAGIIAAQLFDVDVFSSLRGVRAEFNSTAPFGDFRFVLLEYDDDPSVPGEIFWTSETLVATEEGWFDFDMPFRYEFQTGDKVWIGMEWLETGATSINVDNVSNIPGDRASLYLSLDGVTWNWVPLNQFPVPGTYAGNLMLRAVFGHMESAGINGMSEFNVTRDGNEIATGITETTLAETLPSNDVFEYVVESVYLQGNAFSETLTIDASSLGVGEGDVTMPSEFTIGEAYPNPFNPSVAVPITLAAAAEVKLRVFDILGRKVVEVVNHNMAAGSHTLNWTAGGVASGVYFMQVTAGPMTSTQKVVLMR